jgi:hypothetical protein
MTIDTIIAEFSGDGPEVEGERKQFILLPDGARWYPPNQRNGLLPQYARHLISAGVTPETLINAVRRSTCVFKEAKSVGWWASKTVSENNFQPKLKEYVPWTGLKDDRL